MIPVHKAPIVFCDANVLYGNLMRDLLMWLGVRRQLSLRWTALVEEEWTRNLIAHRPDLDAEKVYRTCQRMNKAIPEALVPAASDEDRYDLPDPDDCHVLAAALACEAEVLLTFNLKDFPAQAIPAELQVVHPDVYLTDYFSSQPQAVAAALHSVSINLKRPPLTPEEILAALKKAGLPKFVKAVQEAQIQF